MKTLGTIRVFKTRNFRVEVTAEPEWDVDLSWDDTGEVAEKLQSGEFVVFCVKAACYGPNDEELAADYLGECIYESYAAFENHRGTRVDPSKNIGSYFSGMVRSVCEEGRKAFVGSQIKRAGIRVRLTA